MDELRTIAGWEQETWVIHGREYKVRVIDPDGFDRSDPELFTKLYSREQFEQGMLGSMCRFTKV